MSNEPENTQLQIPDAPVLFRVRVKRAVTFMGARLLPRDEIVMREDFLERLKLEADDVVDTAERL